MTNEELLALKELALKAEPFTSKAGEGQTWEEMSDEDKARTGYNGRFFIEAHAAMPGLIDELMAWRAGGGVPTWIVKQA